MSGGKGSQQTGSATGSTTNPAAAALLPYAEGGWKEAARVAQDPGQYPNYAPPNPVTSGGYNDIINIGQGLTSGFLPTVNQTYLGITGGVPSPAMPGYSTLGAGGTGPQQTLDNVVNYGVNNALNFANPIADYARQATGGNLGQDQLAAVAQGKYTDANSNPYLRDMVNAALRPVSENYQTSTAPTLDARFSAGGRYGSGAADQAAGTARDAFARNLGEISTGMYGDEYRFERGQQDTAATAYDQAKRAGLGLGITGLSTAGNLVDQGLRTVSSAANSNLLGQTAGLAGLQTGFGQMTQAQLDALRQYPQFAGAQTIGPQDAITAGNYFRGEELAPYNAAIKRVQDYMASLGNAPNAGTSTTSPIFGNPLTSAISGATGLVGLGKELGVGSGLNSLFGGGAAAAPFAGVADYGAGGAALGIPDVTAATIAATAPEAAAGSAGKAAAEAAPFFFSDRRFKEDEEVIGRFGALRVYSFRYKGLPEQYTGFMADEVEEIDPGAVYTDDRGVKFVNYARAMRSALK
jgi:hypothetical protein